MADSKRRSRDADLTIPNAAVYTSVQTLEFRSRSAIQCHDPGRLAPLRRRNLAPHVVSKSGDRTRCVAAGAVRIPRGTG